MALPSLSGVTDPDPTIGELIAARQHLRMHAMDGLLLDGIPLNAIADAAGTPVWVYSAPVIRRRFEALRDALRDAGLDAHIHYAVKANDHLAILRLLGGLSAGADVVSGGELRRARAAGMPAQRIVFSGVGKTLDELRLAVAEGIAQINVESAEELDMISALTKAGGRVARVALRINPDVDAGTHGKIRYRPGRGQIRNTVRARAGTIRAGERPAGNPTGRPGSAYRQPDPVARAIPGGVRPAFRTCPGGT